MSQKIVHLIWKNKVRRGGGPKFVSEGGLTNQRPQSDHVIWGPMRGLEKICMGRGQNTNIHTTHGRISWLLDRIGPVGQFNENNQILLVHLWSYSPKLNFFQIYHPPTLNFALKCFLSLSFPLKNIYIFIIACKHRGGYGGRGSTRVLGCWELHSKYDLNCTLTLE